MLLMNIALLLSEYRRLRVLWTDEPYAPRLGSQPKRTVAGHLLWTLGLVLVVAAILVSYQALSLSYWLVGSGLLLAWLSFLADQPRSVATFLPPSAS